MRMLHRLTYLISLLMGFLITPAALAQVTSETIQTRAGAMQVSAVITGLNAPWAFGFLPDGKIIITEREGRLLLATPGAGVTVLDLPFDVHVEGQGGLLDVLVPRDFAQSRTLFFTHAIEQGRGSGTAVSSAVLSADGTSLSTPKTLFESAKGPRGGRHFGSRLVEAADGTLFVTMGDRGADDSAQDRGLHNGSILRITKTGAVPADNPFADVAGVQPEIWSFGHRNPQGAALGADGQLWITEHGARGGDEVNAIRKGANYGWPVISYGTHYSGRKIGEGTAKPGLEQPVHFWDPSIAPSGLAYYDTGAVADWADHLFAGSLKFDYIARLGGSPLREVEQISGDSTRRVRDVRLGPDGALWFLSVGNGALYRMAAPGT